MPLKTDFNVAPYYDDYNVDKNYHRIMFRPSVAVQARELTQLQTILQNQIETFGSWAWRSGDVVKGCTVTDLPKVPYIRLMDFASNGSANTATLDVTEYINAVATSVTSNLTAKVLYANAGFSTNYPDNNILYIKYLDTGEGGETVFSNGELLTFHQVTPQGNVSLANVYTWANVLTDTYTSGEAHGITCSNGIIFINGFFIKVPEETFGLVNNFNTYASNNVVGFTLVEQIVTETQDTSLLDNALGYPNENAPGAHRLKLVPKLVSLSQEQASLTEDFNPIAFYNYGSLVAKVNPSVNVYSIVGDILATRTYEESGNYIVKNFTIDTLTSVLGNEIAPSSSNNVLARVSPGIGYAQGNRVELLKSAHINMRRGVDTTVNKSQIISFNYGSFFALKEVAGTFLTDKAQTVKLYSAAQQAVTNRTYSSVSPAGTYIGTAKARCFTYNAGVVGSASAEYLLHVFDVQLLSGYSINQIKSIYYDGTNKAVGDVVSNGTVDSQNKMQLYSFGVPGIKNLRDAGNNINTDYTYRTTNSSCQMLSTGLIVVRAPGSQAGGSDILTYGSNTTLSDSSASEIVVTFSANADSSALTGNVTVYNTSTNVVGSSTTFTTNFKPGDNIRVGASDVRTVTSVTNATFLNVDAAFGANAAGQTYYKRYPKGKVLQIARSTVGPNAYVTVTNTTSFNVYSGEFPSATVGVEVSFNMQRTVANPASKAIRKNRYVKINTATNPKGPWCLGYSDVHRVRKIYGSATTSFTNANGIIAVDLTSNFSYDTGQQDTHYGLAYIYAKSSYSQSSYPYLLVELDYFAANTSAGVGFFTVESYPVDDANTANTSAIQTKDIPLYVASTGSRIYLRDVVDFRTPCAITANDTGIITNLSNAALINTAVSYATLNPSSTVSLNIPIDGLNFPTYGKNLEADYTMYLPRKDLLLITPENTLKVKEGVSSISPQTPLYPENAMALAVLNVPAYPSLSGDQIDEFQTINQNAVNLIRDTSTAVTSSLVTNRRYTMKDIGTLDNRITNLEYYAQLSLLEKKAKDLTVTDSYGLDRFKNGIFVDPFTDFGLSDVSNPEFAIAIDSDIGVARPRITREIVNIRFNSAASSNVVQTGRLITLQYDSVSFISQRFATKYRSSALVAYAWNGQAQLIPSYDNNIDTNQTASVNMTVDMTAPWREFAASPFGTLWGDWRTRTDVSRTTVITGTASSLVYDAWGRLVSSTPIIGPSTTTTSWSTGDTQTVQSSVAATAQQSLTEAQRVSGTIGLTAASNTTTVTTTVDATRNRLLQFIAGGVNLSNLLSLL
jgi:hypothetical protein